MSAAFNLSYPGTYSPVNGAYLNKLLSYYLNNINFDADARKIKEFPEVDMELLSKAEGKLTKVEQQELVNDIENIAYVDLEPDDNTIEENNKLVLTIKFNQFLHELSAEINRKLNEDKHISYSFSNDLFAKIGNNNLSIKEDDQSAALMFSL